MKERPKPTVRHVYVIGPENGLQKVGMATDPKARLAALQTASPFDLILHLSVAVPFGDAPLIERRAHRLLIRSCVRNEWFETTPAEAVAAVQNAVASVRPAPASPPSSWRYTRPYSSTWSPPDPEALRQVLVERGPSASDGALPLFAFGTRPEHGTQSAAYRLKACSSYNGSAPVPVLPVGGWQVR